MTTSKCCGSSALEAGRSEALDGCEHGVEALRTVRHRPKAHRSSDLERRGGTSPGTARGSPGDGRRTTAALVASSCGAGRSRRRHDGLSRSGRGDEQVPVVSVPSGDGDLLEQALLKRSQVKLRRWQFEPMRLQRRAVSARGTRPARTGSRSSLSQYESKTAVDLGDDIGVAQTGHADVPLQPGHQRAVREVRRPDVRRCRPSMSVEQPRLGVQPCRRHVVGHLDLDTDRRQRVERSRLGAVRVGRGHKANGTTLIAVPAQGRHAAAGPRSTARRPSGCRCVPPTGSRR